MATIKALCDEILQLDGEIAGRAPALENGKAAGVTQALNDDARGRIHDVAVRLVGLLDLEVVAEAVGDAWAFRVGEDSACEPEDVYYGDRYERLGDALGVPVNY